MRGRGERAVGSLCAPLLWLKKTGGKDQKRVVLPWVQSSGNYSLTWKRRQLIHSVKLSVLHKFLCLTSH